MSLFQIDMHKDSIWDSSKWRFVELFSGDILEIRPFSHFWLIDRILISCTEKILTLIVKMFFCHAWWSSQKTILYLCKYPGWFREETSWELVGISIVSCIKMVLKHRNCMLPTAMESGKMFCRALCKVVLSHYLSTKHQLRSVMNEALQLTKNKSI